MKNKVIVITSGKGGIGKSLISNVIGQHPKIKAKIYSNDPKGIYPKIFDNYIRVESFDDLDIEEIRKYPGTSIIDFKGGLSEHVEFVESADLVVVPLMGDINDVSASLDSIIELSSYNDKLLLIETRKDPASYRIEKQKGEDSLLVQSLESNGLDYPFFTLRYAKLFDNATREGMSIYEYLSDGKSIDDYSKLMSGNNYIYRNSITEIEQIIEAITLLTD